MKELIRHRARELGFDDCRFTSAAPPQSGSQLSHWLASGQHGDMQWLARNADKRLNPGLVLPGAKSIVTLAVSYHRGTQDSRESNPPFGTIARYARYNDYHEVLVEPLKQLTTFINTQGGIEARSLWYVDTGPILERDLAQRAGLGFIGKHTNLISRSLGNWIFLAEILTTLELPPDEPEQNRCGSCVRCISACPTAAITAPFRLDARKCISYLTIELKGSIPVELRPQIGNRIYGCDDCLAACPWNRFAREGGLMKAYSRSDLAAPELARLLQLDEPEFNRTYAGSPMLRTKRRGLLRNVCVALGNSNDESALPALNKAKDDAEELIAEHACWAIDQIEGNSRGT